MGEVVEGEGGGGRAGEEGGQVGRRAEDEVVGVEREEVDGGLFGAQRRPAGARHVVRERVRQAPAAQAHLARAEDEAVARRHDVVCKEKLVQDLGCLWAVRVDRNKIKRVGKAFDKPWSMRFVSLQRRSKFQTKTIFCFIYSV